MDDYYEHLGRSDDPTNWVLRLLIVAVVIWVVAYVSRMAGAIEVLEKRVVQPQVQAQEQVKVESREEYGRRLDREKEETRKRSEYLRKKFGGGQ
jgi:predicted Holliday junction resolvase-like endonuclease